MNRNLLDESIYKLIRRTSTELPADVTYAIEEALQQETEASIAYETLDIIKQNAELAAQGSQPICQDTGAVFAVVKSRPENFLPEIREAIEQNIRKLTAEGILRQNCVDPETETNTGDNTGRHAPQIHFRAWDGPTQIHIMLKGGGSENVSTQYALPDSNIQAGRDLEGARRCMLDAVLQAQGKGCAPGILGVCIGGDRASGYLLAKEQLFRKLDDINPVDDLARLEEQVLCEANSLGIGPMGLGGNTTLLGVKIGHACRHPACYFVTISYSCWATRRYAIEIDKKGEIQRWL